MGRARPTSPSTCSSAAGAHLRSALLAALLLLPAGRAMALQPLEDFVRSALQHNLDARDAQANIDNQVGELGSQRSKLLPGLGIDGRYTRNQYKVEFGPLTVMPNNQYDVSATVSVPLVDLAQIARTGAAAHTLQSRHHSLAHTRLEVSQKVTQAFFQLVANLALQSSAQRALATAERSLEVTRDKLQGGQATQLEVSRARAAVSGQRRQLASTELQVAVSVRQLSSLSGEPPADVQQAALPADMLQVELPLDQFSLSEHRVPALAVARASRFAAERNASAERLKLAPALSAQLSEKVSNVTAYAAGHHNVFNVWLALSWKIDFGSRAVVHKAAADASRARIAEARARMDNADAVYNAWHTVASNIERSRAARDEAAASAEAADIAQGRYAGELTTQLDLLQAQRDSFAAEAARIQADADLVNARAQLRLQAGIPLPLNATKEPAR